MWDAEPPRSPTPPPAETERAAREPGGPAEGGEERIYLLAGDWYVSDRPARVTTILGSCVSVCLWDAARRIGGLNHFLMARGGVPAVGKPGRFADLALPRLLDGVLQLGARRGELLAKIFGGAGQFKAGGQATIGAQNVEAARQFLAEHRIPVMAEDAGGERGRRLVFFTETGEAWVKAL